EMTHAVVAMDQRHPGPFLLDANVRVQVHAAGADALQVLRKPDDAVAVGALQVGFGHPRADDLRVPPPHARLHECGGDEVAKVLEADAHDRQTTCRFLPSMRSSASTPFLTPSMFGLTSSARRPYLSARSKSSICK